MNQNDSETAFEVFRKDSFKQENASIQELFEYENHYMRILENHKNDIGFINTLLKENRSEQVSWAQELAKINEYLDEQCVDEEVKKIWLKHLAENMSCSFRLSNSLIEHFTVSKLEEIEVELRKRLEK